MTIEAASKNDEAWSDVNGGWLDREKFARQGWKG